jgi:hypothetical protein
MKTKNFLYLITATVFTILFYRQEAGINFALFVALLVPAAALMNRNRWNTKRFAVVAAGALISAFSVMVYANALTIIISVLSIIMLIIIQRFKNTSYLVSLVGGMSSVFGAVILIMIGRINTQRLEQLRNSQPNHATKRWYAVLIVGMISFLFLSVYRSVSPIFDSYFTLLKGNIDWGWLIFFLFGVVFLYPFFYPPRFLRKLLAIEQRYGKTITEDSGNLFGSKLPGLFSSFENERFSALLLFVILNLLLFILNGTDIQYLFLKGELPDGISYSDYVHSGVGAVILSILMVIAVLLFYFRGSLNFDTKSKYIRNLAYLWIAQNLVLVTLAGFKNQLYIDAYSLTYLRIGVYYFLAFSIIGLLLTLYKIYFKKETWFLFQSNWFGIYIVLVVSCVFNWNTIVTGHNLKSGKEVDYAYLHELGYENYPLLWENRYYESKEKNEFELKLTGIPKTYQLPNHIGYFLQDYENTGIPSYSITKERVYHYFSKQARQGKLTNN